MTHTTSTIFPSLFYHYHALLRKTNIKLSLFPFNHYFASLSLQPTIIHITFSPSSHLSLPLYVIITLTTTNLTLSIFLFYLPLTFINRYFPCLSFHNISRHPSYSTPLPLFLFLILPLPHSQPQASQHHHFLCIFSPFNHYFLSVSLHKTSRHTSYSLPLSALSSSFSHHHIPNHKHRSITKSISSLPLHYFAIITPHHSTHHNTSTSLLPLPLDHHYHHKHPIHSLSLTTNATLPSTYRCRNSGPGAAGVSEAPSTTVPSTRLLLFNIPLRRR